MKAELIARRLAQAALGNIRQNLFFAFVYNSAGVPIAAGLLYPFFGVLLSPVIAAAAMSLRVHLNWAISITREAPGESTRGARGHGLRVARRDVLAGAVVSSMPSRAGASAGTSALLEVTDPAISMAVAVTTLPALAVLGGLGAAAESEHGSARACGGGAACGGGGGGAPRGECTALVQRRGMHVKPRLPQPAAAPAAPATHRVAQRGAVRTRALVPLRHSGGAPAAQQ